jgi:hypothetical protein
MDWAAFLMVRLGISGSELQRFQKKKNLHCSGFFPAQRKKEKRFVSSNLNIPQEKKA